MSIKHFATLVSAGRHPVSGESRHCRNDSIAMTMGLALTNSLNAVAANTSKFKVLHAGDPSNAALTDYLALGASQIDVIPMVSNTNIVDSLAAKLANMDLILTGSRTENGQDSGLLPYLLAEKLRIPLVANALTVKPTANGIEVLQFLPKGKRRSIKVQLPAVVVVHPLAPVELRFAYARQITGAISLQPTSGSVVTTKGANAQQWQTQASIRKPNKLKARENKSGHARMLSATVSENKGGAVVNEGNSVEKAQVILRYLREHGLINF